MIKKVELPNSAGNGYIHPKTVAENVIMGESDLEKVIGESTKLSPIVKQNKSTSKIGQGSNIDVSDSVVDGVFESVTLFGNTMVNLCREIIPSSTNVYQTFAKCNYDMLEPNTVYTLKVKNNTSEQKSYYTNEAITIQKYFIVEPNSENTLTVSTNNLSIKDESLLKNNRNFTSENNVGIVFIKGDHTNKDIPYFEGMKSVTNPIVKTTGKNLFTFSDYEIKPTQGVNYKVNNSNEISVENTLSDTAYRGVSVFLDPQIFRNRRIYARVNVDRILGNDSVCSIRLVKLNGEIQYFTVEERTTYNNFGEYSSVELRFFANSSVVGKSKAIFKNIIFSFDDIVEYEPYKSTTTQSLELVELGSVGNVRDTLDLVSGEVVESVRRDVLNGEDGVWHMGTNPSVRPHIYKLYDSKFTANKMTLIADRVINTIDANPGFESINNGGYDMGNRQLSYFPPVGMTTKNEIIEHLKNNPITIQYELAEKTTRTVTLSSLPMSYQSGHMTLSSDYLTPSVEYSVPMNRKGQVESNTKTIMHQDKRIDELEKTILNTILNNTYSASLWYLEKEEVGGKR